MNELVQALGLLIAVGGVEDQTHTVVIPGAPYSKSRPQFSRNGHVYVKVRDRDAEQLTSTYLRHAVRQPFMANVAIVCIFHRPNRMRIDVDNMLKHVCDSANGILWADDSQATAILGIAELDKKNPRTIVAVAPHKSSLTRGTDATRPCAYCGTPFSIIGITRARRYCSQSCGQRARITNLTQLVPCAQCGEPFRRKTSTQTLCSEKCRVAQLTNVKRGKGGPSSCAACGKVLAHRRGGRCRDCWLKSPNNGQQRRSAS